MFNARTSAATALLALGFSGGAWPDRSPTVPDFPNATHWGAPADRAIRKQAPVQVAQKAEGYSCCNAHNEECCPKNEER